MLSKSSSPRPKPKFIRSAPLPESRILRVFSMISSGGAPQLERINGLVGDSRNGRLKVVLGKGFSDSVHLLFLHADKFRHGFQVRQIDCTGFPGKFQCSISIRRDNCSRRNPDSRLLGGCAKRKRLQLGPAPGCLRDNSRL